MYAVECKAVEKSFGKKKVFDNLSLALEENKIYALLGRNGAGKTTLLKLIATQFLPNQGEILINGQPAYENEEVLKKICFMTETLAGFDGYKLQKIFQIAKNFYENWDEEMKDRLCRIYELEGKEKLSSLSKGKQTAVSLVIGMASRCPIVMFDEIYSGMDPQARQKFYEILIEDYEKQPRTFLVSTHLIDEMSQMFTDAVIIDKGQILLCESMEAIHEKAWKCVGRKELIEELDSVNVLSRKYIGSIGEAAFYGELSPEQAEDFRAQGMELSSLSLQELFLAITNDK
jgi:ABC-2 type transport system ATP-binding protein